MKLLALALAASSTAAAAQQDFNIFQHIGGNAQWYPGEETTGISSEVPERCKVDLAAFFSRHGSRYPDRGAYNGWVEFSKYIQAAGNFTVTNPKLAFLKTWKPVLSDPEAQIANLSPTGWKELHEMGTTWRLRYPDLYEYNTPFTMWSNYYTSGPRVRDSARLFAQGFVGPNATDLTTIYALNASNPASWGNSLASSDLCKAYDDEGGSPLKPVWDSIYLTPIAARLNSKIYGGLNLTNGCCFETPRMAMPELIEQHGLRIAVEGCGHGVLHEIYASVAKSCEIKGWPDVDLLIIGGDFQAVRNASDLKAVSMPSKYYAMHDFHEYYSGARLAPYLTIFIGGNHEASNYMWELSYGGWAAPKIYYMGAANVIRLGPLRIAGLSGIWKGYNFKKPHYERLPYNSDDVKSIYHVRELEVRKLLQIRTQVDIGLSHDWPRGMEWKGNFRQLFKWKPDFEQEAKDGTLGSVAAKTVLERLRPPHWFSAHMHAKFPAVWKHVDISNSIEQSNHTEGAPAAAVNASEIDLDMADDADVSAPKNDAEIDLGMDEDEAPAAPVVDNKEKSKPTTTESESEISQDIRSLLPESFSRPKLEPAPTLPFPEEITNKTTKFLALDKCLPKRNFLQLLEIEPHEPAELQRPLGLQYDKEWLAITRVFADHVQVGDPHFQVPRDKGDAFYRPLIEKEMEWVEENIVKANKMMVPEDFAQTAPTYDAALGIHVQEQPSEYSNPHTQRFCDLVQIPNVFHASDEERAQLASCGPRPEQQRANRGGGRGGGRGGWGKRGSGRGQGHGGRGRGGRGGRGRGGW